jgi:hypothetical protein
MTRQFLRVCAILVVPLLAANAQPRTAAPSATASATAVATPKRAWAAGRFILEVNGATRKSWEYDAATGTLSARASHSAVARSSTDIGIVVSTEEAPCASAADVTCAAAAARADGAPIPGVGIVVKNTSSRVRMRLTLDRADVSPSYAREAGQLVSFFPMPSSLTDATYELTVSLPKELIPAGAAGAHEVTFVLRKVPGGYDAVRATVVR